MSQQVEPLFGRWMGRINGEPVGMEFRPDGRMAYVILSGNKTQTIRLTYRVEGDVLITDQPSHPREERTRFRFDADGTLVLSYEGSESRFVKSSEPAAS